MHKLTLVMRHLGIADAMYAPVVLRFRAYAVELQGAARSYADMLLALPAVQEWIDAAMSERGHIPCVRPVRLTPFF